VHHQLQPHSPRKGEVMYRRLLLAFQLQVSG
jgi:hypothetical protein